MIADRHAHCNTRRSHIGGGVINNRERQTDRQTRSSQYSALPYRGRSKNYLIEIARRRQLVERRPVFPPLRYAVLGRGCDPVGVREMSSPRWCRARRNDDGRRRQRRSNGALRQRPVDLAAVDGVTDDGRLAGGAGRRRSGQRPSTGRLRRRDAVDFTVAALGGGAVDVPGRPEKTPARGRGVGEVRRRACGVVVEGAGGTAGGGSRRAAAAARRPPRSTQSRSSAASDVYKRQI